MNPSTSRSDYESIPGRFPSPTPSLESNVAVDDQTVPTTHIPVNHGEPRLPAVLDRLDFTAPGQSRQRPLFSGTQSEQSLSPLQQYRRHRRNSPGQAFTPPRPGARPFVNRRAVSDTQHDRARNRVDSSLGSPIRRHRRRFQQPQDSHSGNIQSRAGPSHLTAQRIHEELKRKIRGGVNRPGFSRGVVYVLRDPDRPHLLKIGSTMNLDQRWRQQERGCNITFDVIYRSKEIKNYGRAEKLAHIDLGHLQKKFFCGPCSVTHEEFFEVDQEIAETIVERWVEFLREEPYDGDGHLKGLWDHIMSRREAQFYPSGTWSHMERWNCWTSMVTSPSKLDYSRYTIWSVRQHPFWFFLWNFSWQVYAVVSWCLTCYVSRSGLTFVMLVVVVGCALFSMSPSLPGLVRTKNRRG